MNMVESFDANTNISHWPFFLATTAPEPILSGQKEDRPVSNGNLYDDIFEWQPPAPPQHTEPKATS